MKTSRAQKGCKPKGRKGRKREYSWGSNYQCLHHSHTLSLPFLIWPLTDKGAGLGGPWGWPSRQVLLFGPVRRRHLHQLNVVSLSQSFTIASACNNQKNIFLCLMETKHLQRRNHRGSSIHQQLQATLGQKHSKDGAWGKAYFTGSMVNGNGHCILIFCFVHCLNTLSFKMVTDCMQRGGKDFFFLISFYFNSIHWQCLREENISNKFKKTDTFTKSM